MMQWRKVRLGWASCISAFTLLSILFLLGACGLTDSTPATSSNMHAGSVNPGITPFIPLVELDVNSMSHVTVARYRIEPKPGAVSKALDDSHSIAALRRRGHVTSAMDRMVLPAFIL